MQISYTKNAAPNRRQQKMSENQYTSFVVFSFKNTFNTLINKKNNNINRLNEIDYLLID